MKAQRALFDQPTPQQSQQIDKLAAALSKAQGEISNASKDSTNPFFDSRYASLANVIDTVRDALAKYGLSFVQRVTSRQQGVIVSTQLLHESGQWLVDEGPWLPVSKRDAQGYGSAITYGRRYGLSSMLGVTQADDDGNDSKGGK